MRLEECCSKPNRSGFMQHAFISLCRCDVYTSAVGLGSGQPPYTRLAHTPWSASPSQNLPLLTAVLKTYHESQSSLTPSSPDARGLHYCAVSRTQLFHAGIEGRHFYWTTYWSCNPIRQRNGYYTLAWDTVSNHTPQILQRIAVVWLLRGCSQIGVKDLMFASFMRPKLVS